MKKFKDFSMNEDYEGNIIEFLQGLNDAEISSMIDDILDSDDVDERMDAADRLCFYVEQTYPEYYNDVEGDIKDLAIG